MGDVLAPPVGSDEPTDGGANPVEATEVDGEPSPTQATHSKPTTTAVPENERRR
jgi:hypothetical protein